MSFRIKSCSVWERQTVFFVWPSHPSNTNLISFTTSFSEFWGKRKLDCTKSGLWTVMETDQTRSLQIRQGIVRPCFAGDKSSRNGPHIDRVLLSSRNRNAKMSWLWRFFHTYSLPWNRVSIRFNNGVGLGVVTRNFFV